VSRGRAAGPARRATAGEPAEGGRWERKRKRGKRREEKKKEKKEIKGNRKRKIREEEK
jgi:hypothetical protein